MCHAHPQESISSVMHRHTSYFPSVHIIIIQGVVALSLLVLRPSLWGMMWTALEKKDEESAASDSKLTLVGLGDGRCHIDQLLKLAVKHLRHHSLVAFVPVSRLSSTRGLLPQRVIPRSPIIVSPIYRPIPAITLLRPRSLPAAVKALHRPIAQLS